MSPTRKMIGCSRVHPEADCLYLPDLHDGGAQSDLVRSIAELVDKGVITGVSDVRDESDRTGMRVVVEAKRDSFPQARIPAAHPCPPAEAGAPAQSISLLHTPSVQRTAVSCGRPKPGLHCASQPVLKARGGL